MFLRISFLVKVVFSLCVGTVYGQNLVLKKTYSDLRYYNAVFYEGRIILGTSEGPLEYNTGEILPFENNYNEEGFLSVRDGKITSGEFLGSNEYHSLVPEVYKNAPYSTSVFNELLFLFVKGTLLVYEMQPYRFYPSPSVRSITNDLLGTYGGILDYDLKPLEGFPSYTSGKIVPVSGGVAVCWDGLTVYRDGAFVEFSNLSNGQVLIGGEELGRARELIEIDKDKWLLSSTKGVYLVDINLNTSKPIIEVNNGVEPRIKYLDENKILYSAVDKLFSYNIGSGSSDLIYESEQEIIDFYFLSGYSILFILHENNLIEINNAKNSTYTIIDGLKEPLNVFSAYNKLFVTTNFGLDIYDLESNRHYKSILNDEFNRHAYYNGADILRLGTINGYYEINLDLLNSMFYLYDAKSIKEPINRKNNENPFLYVVLILLVVTLILIVQLLRVRSNTKKLIQSYSEYSVEEKIKKYIQANISTVTLSNICDAFEVDLNELYKVFEETTPGEFIRSERIKIVKRMRREKVSEAEIAKATGFSVSYLKKI